MALTAPAGAAFAGPFASPAMGNAAFVDFKPSLHVGGFAGGNFGQAPTLMGGALLELQLADVMAAGLLVDHQRLLVDPLTAETGFTSLRVRARWRIPLVEGKALYAPAVPVFWLGAEMGGRVTPAPESDPTRLMLGATVGFDVVTGRVTPFVAVGYRHLFLPNAPSLHAVEVQLGITVRLAGRTNIGPIPPRPARVTTERHIDTDQMCAQAPPGSRRARFCAAIRKARQEEAGQDSSPNDEREEHP